MELNWKTLHSCEPEFGPARSGPKNVSSFDENIAAFFVLHCKEHVFGGQ